MREIPKVNPCWGRWPQKYATAHQVQIEMAHWAQREQTTQQLVSQIRIRKRPIWASGEGKDLKYAITSGQSQVRDHKCVFRAARSQVRDHIRARTSELSHVYSDKFATPSWHADRGHWSWKPKRASATQLQVRDQRFANTSALSQVRDHKCAILSTQSQVRKHKRAITRARSQVRDHNCAITSAW